MITTILHKNLSFKYPSSLCNSNVAYSLLLLNNNFSTSLKQQPITNPTTVSDFLLKKHHFSPEAVSQIAYILPRLKNPEKSDSVLSFLKEIGFSKTLVEKIVKSRPELLSTNIEISIKPRIKLFGDLGFSSNDIAKVVSSDPWIFKKSVCNVVPNVEFLKASGVSMEQIVWATCYFRRFILSNPVQMRRFVEKVDEMGVKRGSKMFIHCVRIVSSMNEHTWEQKMTTFRKLGFTDEDIAATFRQAPLVFGVSEEKINDVKELLLGTGKYDMSCIVDNPIAFMYSIERRYKPRVKVLEVLESKGLIERWPFLATFCRMSDKRFYERYVGPYLDEVGDLYLGKSVIIGNKM